MKNVKAYGMFMVAAVGFICEAAIIAGTLMVFAVVAVETGRKVAPSLDWPEPIWEEPAAPVVPVPAPVQEIQQETPKKISLLELPNHVMGSMSVEQQIKTVYISGLVLETVGKGMPKHPITGGFTHSFLRQFGCQLQVSAMQRAGLINPNPSVAFVQGVLVGL